MPQVSRYTDQQIESLLLELETVLHKHNAQVDLALIVLGNMATHLINSQIRSEKREFVANSFADALLNSVNKNDRTH